MLTLDQTLRIHPDAVDTELDTDELVVLQLESKSYYSLNATGMRIWRGLKTGLTLAEISRLLQVEFEVGSEEANRSVLRMADELSREKLVQMSG